nr:hypothetical protein [Tanacetum cinerariifolium]
SAKRTSWNEFSFAMASALICLSSEGFCKYAKGWERFLKVETPLFETMLAVRDIAEEAEAQIPAQDDDVQEHAVEEVATDVVPTTPTSPSPPSPVIPSSPPHQSPCPPQPQAAEGSSHVFQQVLDTCSALVLRVKGLENANAAQQLEIVKLKAKVTKLEKLNKVKSSKLKRLRKVGTSQCVEFSDDVENVFNQGRINKQAEIYNIDLDHSSKVLSMQEDDTEVQEAVEVVTTAKLITEVVTTAATQVVAASTPISAAKPKVLKIAAASAVSTRKRKGVVIRDPEEELHIDTLAETPTQVPDKCFALVLRVKGLESDNTAQQLEILKLKARVKKLERLNKVKSSKLRHLKKVGTSQRIKSSEDEENVFNQGRIRVDIDEGIELVLSMQEDSEVQEVVEVVNAAKLITKVVTAATTQVIPAAEPVVAAVSTPISVVKPKVLKIVPTALTVSTRKRKGVVIRDPKEELHDDTPAETQSAKDKGKGIFVEDPKPMKKKDQIAMDAEYARKLQEEEESLAQAKDAQATDVQLKDALAKRI